MIRGVREPRFGCIVASIHLLYVWPRIFLLPRISQCTDILFKIVTMNRNLPSVSARTGLPGFGPRQEYKVSFSPSCSDQLWRAPTVMYSECWWRFPQVRSGRSIKLTTHIYLVQRLSRFGTLTVTLIHVFMVR